MELVIGYQVTKEDSTVLLWTNVGCKFDANLKYSEISNVEVTFHHCFGPSVKVHQGLPCNPGLNSSENTNAMPDATAGLCR